MKSNWDIWIEALDEVDRLLAGPTGPVGVGVSDALTGFAKRTRDSHSKRRSYRAQLRIFVTWCLHHPKHRAFPAHESTVAEFFAWRVDNTVKAGGLIHFPTKEGTMSAAWHAIRWLHCMHGLPDPTDTPEVLASWPAIIEKANTRPPTASLTLTLGQLKQAMGPTPSEPGEGPGRWTRLTAWRDRAMLAIALFGGCSVSEICAMDMEYVAVVAGALQVKIFRVASAKKRARWQTITMEPTHNVLCPVAAFLGWQRLHPIGEGPMMIQLQQGGGHSGKRVHARALNRRLQAMLGAAGIDASGYTYRSIRKAAIAAAAGLGASAASIGAMMGVSAESVNNTLRSQDLVEKTSADGRGLLHAAVTGMSVCPVCKRPMPDGSPAPESTTLDQPRPRLVKREEDAAE